MEDFLNNVKMIKNRAKDICDRNIEHFIGCKKLLTNSGSLKHSHF